MEGVEDEKDGWMPGFSSRRSDVSRGFFACRAGMGGAAFCLPDCFLSAAFLPWTSRADRLNAQLAQRMKMRMKKEGQHK
ncbi:MAG: hypothetical protein RR893_04760 [Clostridia bacterium]